jgi:hypothetical protein
VPDFVNDQGLNAQVVQGSIVTIVLGVQVDIPKNSPKGPHIGAYLFEPDSRPVVTDKLHGRLPLFARITDALQQHIDPGCMFHDPLLSKGYKPFPIILVEITISRPDFNSLKFRKNSSKSGKKLAILDHWSRVE